MEEWKDLGLSLECREGAANFGGLLAVSRNLGRAKDLAGRGDLGGRGGGSVEHGLGGSRLGRGGGRGRNGVHALVGIGTASELGLELWEGVSMRDDRSKREGEEEEGE